MTDFYEHKLNLEQPQIKKLLKGASSTIKHLQIGSGMTIHLMPANHKKILSAYGKQKNIRLKMSKDELDRNEKEGTGFYRFLHHKLGIKGAKKGLKTLGKTVAKTVVPVLAEVAGNAVGTATGNPLVGAMAGNVLGNIAQNQVDKHLGKGLFKSLHKMGVKGVKGKVRNIVRKVKNEAVHQGINKVSNMLNDTILHHTGDSNLANIVSKYGNELANGAVAHYIDGGYLNIRVPVKQGSGIQSSSNPYTEYPPYINGYSSILPANHPSNNPFIPRPYLKGGSFLPVGY